MTKGESSTHVLRGLPTIQPAKTVEYETPRRLFDQWWEEVGGFDMDPFCRPEHYTAARVLNHATPVPGGMDYQGTICMPPPAEHESYHIDPALKQRVLVDGLAHPWHGKVFMNSPYGPFLREAIPYAVGQVECGNAELVMALLPAKTEVQWFQEWVMRGVRYSHSVQRYSTDAHRLVSDLRFLPGRLHFGGGDGPARVGNVLVVWRK